MDNNREICDCAPTTTTTADPGGVIYASPKSKYEQLTNW